MAGHAYGIRKQHTVIDPQAPMGLAQAEYNQAVAETEMMYEVPFAPAPIEALPPPRTFVVPAQTLNAGSAPQRRSPLGDESHAEYYQYYKPEPGTRPSKRHQNSNREKMQRDHEYPMNRRWPNRQVQRIGEGVVHTRVPGGRWNSRMSANSPACRSLAGSARCMIKA